MVMIKLFVLIIILSACLSLVLTPLVIRLAKFIGVIDKPDERKIHKIPTPRMGGLAPFVSFFSTCLLVYFFVPGFNMQGFMSPLSWLTISVSLIIILLLGVFDDILILKPGKKFFVQFIAASLVYSSGIRFSSFSLPFSYGIINIGILSYPLTVIWVIGITNAFNLIDGLDGLAAGIAAISSLTITAIAFLHNDTTTAVICLALTGSLIGFLRYNFNPAKIFLGDSGSLFIGFTLALLSIQSATKGSTVFSILLPVLVIGIPVFDTLMSMLRRMLNWFLPEHTLKSSILNKIHSMFLPDKRHIHHQLLASGFSQRQVVFLLYLVSCTFGICAYLITAGSINASTTIVVLGIAIAVVSKRLGYREILVIKNGILLKLYRFTFLKHRLIRILLDLTSVFAAFFLAALLSSLFSLFQQGMVYLFYSMVIICSLQIIAFVLGGLYKHSVQMSGIGDFLQIAKSTFIAIGITSVAVYFFPLPGGWKWISTHSGIFITLDFYFLISLVAGSRIMFHILNYIFYKDSFKGKRILIYGAGYKGLITLQAVLHSSAQAKKPIGFLDDDPALEGQYLNGYPIFGSHWKLEGLINKNFLDEIIVASENISENVLNKIIKIASRNNIPVRISNMEFTSIAVEKNQLNKIIPGESGILNVKTI